MSAIGRIGASFALGAWCCARAGRSGRNPPSPGSNDIGRRSFAVISIEVSRKAHRPFVHSGIGSPPDANRALFDLSWKVLRGLPEGRTAMQLRGGGGHVEPVEGRLSEPSTGDAYGRPSEQTSRAPMIEAPEGPIPSPDVAVAWMLRLVEWHGGV